MNYIYFGCFMKKQFIILSIFFCLESVSLFGMIKEKKTRMNTQLSKIKNRYTVTSDKKKDLENTTLLVNRIDSSDIHRNGQPASEISLENACQ